MFGEISLPSMESQVLLGNPLADSTRRQIAVYVPPGKGPFPVVLLLPGFGSNATALVGSSSYKKSTAQLFDRALARGATRPAILVMPDCDTRFGGSQFIDSPATGDYQRFIADEVFHFVETNFPAHKGPAFRAAVGRSSGGFGALRLALDRPDVVSVVASHAGDADFELSMRPMLTRAAVAIRAAGGFDAFCQCVEEKGPKSPLDFDGAFVLACSLAYAQTSVVGEDILPVSIETGALVEHAWKQWLSHDPLSRIASSSHIANIKKVFVDAGDSDEHGLQYAARNLASALVARGLDVAYEEFAGGHRGTSYRYGLTLPQVIEALYA